MNVLFEIIIMLLILGVLVSIHEAGHLAMAKLFKVYCFEYSIGMGPAILHKRKKGHETYFSIRSIPFGGYVSMYGEAENVTLPEGESLPSEDRSIENIAKWKKVIILFAGVFLNFVLGLILIFISVSCFKQYAYGSAIVVGESQEYLVYVDPTYETIDEVTRKALTNRLPGYEVKDYSLSLGYEVYEYNDGETFSSNIVLPGKFSVSTVGGSQETYIPVYAPSTLTESHSLLDDLYFYPKMENVTLDSKYTSLGIEGLPDINETATNYFAPSDGKRYKGELTLYYCPVFEAARQNVESFSIKDNTVPVTYSSIEYFDGSFEGLDLEIDVVSYRNDFKRSIEKWCYYVPYCCTAIFKGLISLFSVSGLQNLSGIVGMTSMVGTYSAMGGASMLFMFAGLISINLAFFNLLPFPGLDGYQIVVTTIEGVTKKKVPTKVKQIVSIVGLMLLFGLMIFVTISDIIKLM